MPKRAKPKAPLKGRTSSNTASWAKRLAAWIGGLLVATLATYFSGIFSNTLEPLFQPAKIKARELACLVTTPQVQHDDSRFQILISPLVADADQSHSRRLISALTGGVFNVTSICEQIGFNTYAGTDASLVNVRNQGIAILKKYGADLIIFGNVARENESLELWEVNSSGGCEPRPRHIVLNHGFVPNETYLDKSLSDKLISETVAELSAACDHTASTDWDLVERRIKKVQRFLESPPANLAADQIDDIAGTYSDAVGLLYKYGNKNSWYQVAANFNIDRANRVHANQPQRRALWLTMQGFLVHSKWEKTKDPSDLTAAISYYSDALKLHPTSYTYQQRGSAYEQASNLINAIADLSAALIIDPSNEEISKQLKNLHTKTSSR